MLCGVRQVDPSSAEESVMRGRLSVAVNQHGDLCAIHKAGGLPIDMQPLQHCMQVGGGYKKQGRGEGERLAVCL